MPCLIMADACYAAKDESRHILVHKVKCVAKSFGILHSDQADTKLQEVEVADCFEGVEMTAISEGKPLCLGADSPGGRP